MTGLSSKTGITLSASLGMCGKGGCGEVLISTIIYQIKLYFERSGGMHILWALRELSYEKGTLKFTAVRLPADMYIPSKKVLVP